MEYVVLWILALFGLWSLIYNILNSFYNANNEEIFDVVLDANNKEDSIQSIVSQLSKLSMVRRIKILTEDSTDSTKRVIEEIQKNNHKVTLE